MKWSHLHLVLVFVWLGLLWPTLTVWRDSVTWVAIMSLYANVVGHWSAVQAALADEHTQEAK